MIRIQGSHTIMTFHYGLGLLFMASWVPPALALALLEGPRGIAKGTVDHPAIGGVSHVSGGSAAPETRKDDCGGDD